MFRNYKVKNLNIKLIIAIVLLTIIGILVVGSANPIYQRRQIIGMILGLIVMTFIALLDYEFVLQFSWIYYGITVLILLLVLFIGDTSGGATRWIDLGFIRFQPSELAKVLLILFFSAYLADNEEKINEPIFLAKTAALAGIPLLLIVREPDLSTTIVTFMIIAMLLFLSGLTYKIVGPVVGIGLPVLGAFIFMIDRGVGFLTGYQNLRILAWLHPEDYPQASYQQQNAIMAIGSGQFWGKGLYNDAVDSVKNGNYIAEPQNDFVFAVAGEEMGFLGSVIIVLLLLFISYQCTVVAKSAKNIAGKYICYGMASLVAFQSFVNICVVTGLFPNTGLPLPFVSYGLTSLVTLYFGMGFVINVGLQSNKRRNAI